MQGPDEANSSVIVDPAICGEPQVCTLWGGKTIDVGTITVSNDEDNLYVKYETTGDWYLTQVHLYVLTSAPTERLSPGQAPYKVDPLPEGTKSFTFSVPFLPGFDVTCDETILYLQAHAAVERIVDGTTQEETAYGTCDVEEPETGAWYGNIDYMVQCCDDEPPVCEEFKDETAWAAGSRYVTKGNWATYTSYSGVPKSVTLFAGQTMNAGTVAFSASVNGVVTITITLTGDWEFADVMENVKIQDYATAPSGNPSPGLFAHKGTATASPFIIEVPENSFYGVHADVGQWVEVPCPEE